MKTIFISQPMNGLTPSEIKTKRTYITSLAERFYKDKIIVIESYLEDCVSTNIKNKPVYYLGKSIEMMNQADIVIFANGYDKTKGCLIEHIIASTYGLKIQYENVMRDELNSEAASL